MEIFTLFVAAILLVLPFFDWTAFSILRKATYSGGIAIKERTGVAGILAIATTINAFLGASRIFGWRLDPFVAALLLSTSLILISIPNIYWLSLYFRNKLKR